MSMPCRPSPARHGLMLRLEAAALAASAVVLYSTMGASWRLFAALVLVPNLSFLGYLANSRIGAAVYNAVHTTLAPIALALVGLFAAAPICIAVALIWLTHIGADRLLGYGFKYNGGFGFTHLGRIGPRTCSLHWRAAECRNASLPTASLPRLLPISGSTAPRSTESRYSCALLVG